ncbi:MAG: hypothetical protein ACTSR2_09390, partial [Candidatus Hodarchaeales archaeon]
MATTNMGGEIVGGKYLRIHVYTNLKNLKKLESDIRKGVLLPNGSVVGLKHKAEGVIDILIPLRYVRYFSERYIHDTPLDDEYDY